MASDIYKSDKHSGSMYRSRAGWAPPEVPPRKALNGLSTADRIAAGLLLILVAVLVTVFVFVLR